MQDSDNSKLFYLIFLRLSYKMEVGWGYTSLIKHLVNIQKALYVIPTPQKKKKQMSKWINDKW